MVKIMRKMSLKWSFSFYVVCGIIAAFFLSLAIGTISSAMQDNIYEKYHDDLFQDKVLTVDGIEIENSLRVSNVSWKDVFSRKDKILFSLCNIMQTVMIPIIFAIAILLTGIVFYRKKLKKPLAILNSAASRIAGNDLDFTVAYDSGNEFGVLAESFEKMRFALYRNNLEMWRQMEERKRLNAAFSHDLRTPLTVLKGHVDLLARYVPEGKITNEKIGETANIMASHITRLENYTEAMNRLQRLEDIEINKTEVRVYCLCDKLKDTLTILCKEKETSFVSGIDSNRVLSIDEEIVIQVFENILSNALRYALHKITIDLELQDNMLSLTVKDDGRGFSLVDLDKADHPFYKAAENIYNSHFGLGLNICKILCERHEGRLLFSNAPEGGAKVCAKFFVHSGQK